MAYPTYILCTLTEVNGVSCQTPAPNHRLEWDAGASPPRYSEIAGQGDFSSATLERDDSGGTTTWTLTIVYQGRTACDGTHSLIRAVAADDPTGDFYGDDNGTPDSSIAQATCVDDD